MTDGCTAPDITPGGKAVEEVAVLWTRLAGRLAKGVSRETRRSFWKWASSICARVGCGIICSEAWRAHLLPEQDGDEANTENGHNQSKSVNNHTLIIMLLPSGQHSSTQLIQVSAHTDNPSQWLSILTVAST